MNNLPTNQSALIWARWLTGAACIFWLTSLALPGFMVYSRAQPFFGIEILLYGLLFGWAVQGWAAYANIFFVHAIIKAIFDDRNPRVSVSIMFALGTMLPFFKGVIQDEGSMAILSVISWGWGAVIWLFSLVLLTTATAIRLRIIAQLGAKITIGLLLGTFVFLSGLHFYQRSFANTQEQNLYLSAGMAFTRAQLCGIPLTIVDAPLLPPDAIVTLDVDPILKSSESYLRLPQLFRYQEGNFAWITTFQDQKETSFEVKVRVPIRDNNPVLQAKSTPRGAILQLLNQLKGKILYEQRLKFNGHGYCPMSTLSGIKDLKEGYDTNLLRALGQDQIPIQSKKNLIEENARIPCDVGKENKDGINGLREWDGRQVILQPESLRSQVGFCSASYIVLLYISEHNNADLRELSPSGMVFDRKTLRPLAVFNDGKTCWGRCSEAPHEIIQGVRISDNEIIIETTAGELSAKKFRDYGEQIEAKKG